MELKFIEVKVCSPSRVPKKEKDRLQVETVYENQPNIIKAIPQGIETL